MAYGIVGYSQQNNLDQPSGSIWGDCSAQELLDEGTGYFDFKDFKTRLPQTADGSTVTWAIDSGTIAWNTHYDSVITLTTGATSSDDAGIATRPLGPIAPGGGQKIWFEALVSVAQITNAQSMFVGVANLASLGSKNLMVVSSATKNSNTIGTSSGKQSFYGFWMHGDTPTNFDAVWANQITTALTPTSIGAYSSNTSSSSGSGLVLANVLTPTITQYPNAANPLGYVVPTGGVPTGALIVTATASATPTGYGTAQTPQQLLHIGPPPSAGISGGATGFVKLGIRYDGQQYLYFYVNGVQVAKMVITSGNDTVSDFAGIVQVQTGTANATGFNIGFERTAALIYP